MWKMIAIVMMTMTGIPRHGWLLLTPSPIDSMPEISVLQLFAQIHHTVEAG